MNQNRTMAERLGRIEGQLEEVLRNQERDYQERSALGVQVRKLENRVNWYSGAAAIIGALIGVTSTHLPRM